MDKLEQLLSDLVAIDSINPDLVPGAAGEAEIAGFIAAWLARAGLEVHQHEPVPGRPNVVGIARGTGGGKTLMLNGHMDTVGVSGMAGPHMPLIRDGRLYGRGSYDMKGGVAACMLAAAEAAKRSLRGDVVFTAVMDEEYAGLGTMDIARRYRADAAIVSESTELQLIVAHKGFVWLEVETQGVAAHGSRPELGVDAIVKMGPVLIALEALDHSLRAHPSHKLLGSGSVHASLIDGGQELSTYPQTCVLSLERRTLPGETPDQVEAELHRILADIAARDPAFQAVVRRGLYRAPMETPAGAKIVSAIQNAAAGVTGRPIELAGVPYWTDAATLWEAGIPSVLFGPAGAGAHAVEEWVDLDSVRACSQIYLETALEFCR
jgi:acetylornithine deacetylase